MKSKELIRLLQEEDPTGETEVSIGNHDIFSAHTEPAYWDGKLQLLIRDDKKKPYYDVVGAKYVVQGSKIVLTSMGVTDVLWDDPDAAIDYSELETMTGNGSASYRQADDKTRQASRNVTLKVEMDAFHRWVQKQTENIRPGEECRGVSDDFYERNLSPDNPVKDLPPKKEIRDGKEYEVWPSWNDRREAMWNDTLEVYWSGGWGIRRKEEMK